MNYEIIITALIAAVPPTIMALAAYRQARETHKSVNSRMTELLALAKKAAADEATLIEKAAEKVRTASKRVAK